MQVLYSAIARDRLAHISKVRFLEMCNPSISNPRIQIQTVMTPDAVKDPRNRGDSR